MLKPGQPYEFTIEIYPTSLLFAARRRIRLDISSSNFRGVNPNTGEPLNNNRRAQTEENAIYFNGTHPSAWRQRRWLRISIHPDGNASSHPLQIPEI